MVGVLGSGIEKRLAMAAEAAKPEAALSDWVGATEQRQAWPADLVVVSGPLVAVGSPCDPQTVVARLWVWETRRRPTCYPLPDSLTKVLVYP